MIMTIFDSGIALFVIPAEILTGGQSIAEGLDLFHLILYSVLIVSVTWLILRSQGWLLIKTTKALKQKESALQELESQRDILKIKNNSITDSLIYAQRIQEALLPSEDVMRKYFSSSFILYKPRDIVSGDFYWIGEKADRLFIVAGDCTGHGVPGALMSMIAHDLLEKFIIGEDNNHPGEILDKMNEALAYTFRAARNSGTIIHDGMDIGICAIDKRIKKIEYAGAFFPLYIIRDNRLLETKGDKFILGNVPHGAKYRNNEIDLAENDILYMFSDGYIDQFGGEDNKKFMYRRFRYLLMTIHSFLLEDQKSILEDNINSWRGLNSQVDDILVIGFRPK